MKTKSFNKKIYKKYLKHSNNPISFRIFSKFLNFCFMSISIVGMLCKLFSPATTLASLGF
jgi:hypothetical protein